MSGDPIPEELEDEEVDEECTVGDIENLHDSMRQVEASSALAEKLGEETGEEVDVKMLTDLFKPKEYEGVGDVTEITLGQIADKLDALFSDKQPSGDAKRAA